jgi:O-antigen/teichoic acid export membrane protein/thymidylate kinase
MIIEFFGPPGVGKTTLAHALLDRLREQGYATEIELTHRPGEVSSLDPCGFGAALRRVSRAMAGVVAMALHPFVNKRAFSTAARLLQILPPRNIVWFIRFSQYILRLSKVWHRISDSDPIVIFDQGFIQAICSLAMFNRSADEAALLRALSIVPHSDIMIHVSATLELLEDRLRDRIRRETVMERFLEADPNTNLQAASILERINTLLERRREAIIAIEVDEHSSIDQTIDIIEQKIVDKLQDKCRAAAARGNEDAVPPDESDRVYPGGLQIAGPAASMFRYGSSAGHVRRNESHRRTHTGIWALIVYVGGAGLACAVQFLIAKLVHAESYGVYSYVTAWVALMSYGATLGLSVFILRFAAAYRAAERWSLMRGAIQFAVRRALLAALLVVGIGLLILMWRWDHLEPEFAVSMAIGIVTIPLITLQLVGSSVVRVFGGFIAAILPERVFRDGLFLALTGFAAWWSFWPMDARLVMVGLFVSSAIALAFVVYAALTRWPEQIRGIRPTYLPSDWWAFALPIMVMMGFEILMTRTGVILLGWRGRIAEAGTFALAFNMAMLVQLPRAAVSTYFSPGASALHARRDFAGLQDLFARATVLTLAGGAMLAMPVLLLAGPLLRLFGQEFAGATHIIQILVVGQLVAAAAGPQENLLTMTGHERSAVVIMLAFTMLNIAGCAIAITHYGGIGAAVVTSAALVAWNSAMAIQIKRRLDLTPGLASAVAGLQWSMPAE